MKVYLAASVQLASRSFLLTTWMFGGIETANWARSIANL